MNSTVSVIVPNYNHAPYLKKRIESILQQTYQDMEVILMDDASTDTSLAILKTYENHPKVSHLLVNTENSGSPYHQWLKGMRLAKGAFIWIAESDDFCEPNFLEMLVPKLQDNHVAVAQTQYYFEDGSTKRVAHPAFKKGNRTSLENDEIFYCPSLNVSAQLFRAPSPEALSAPEFVKYHIIGDRVFYFEFFQHTYWELIPETQSYFRKVGDGLSNLDTKGRDYLAKYFEEHRRFIAYVQQQEGISKSLAKAYVKRFFNRVRHRLSRKQKCSWAFAKVYWRYLTFKG